MSMMDKKEWSDFYATGLLMFVNTFLHIFGWSLVFSFDDEDKIISVYPARVKFRGFSHDTQDEAFKKLSEYMASNAEDLLSDCEGE